MLLAASAWAKSSAKKPAIEEVKSAPSKAYLALEPLLHKSQGKLTPELRQAYLRWAEAEVLRELAAANKGVAGDCLAEVEADPDLRDSIYGAVYPPDPNILYHYNQLRTELGPDFTRRWRSLVVGVAISCRKTGLDAVPGIVVYQTKNPVNPATGISIVKESGEDKWIDPNTGLDAADTTEPDADGDDENKEETNATAAWPYNDALSKATAEFLKEKGFTALSVRKDVEQRRQLGEYLTERGVDAKKVAQFKKGTGFYAPLRGAMILLGQRPAERDKKPSAAEWLRYLTQLYRTPIANTPQTKKGPMPWPLFPMDKAPWPLTMPFGRTIPIREARYILEKFQGQHGGKPYHLYGPYNTGAYRIPLELEPSPWHWRAWPSMIKHGGVCTIMCKIGCSTHLALGEPAMLAGQPGHANLATYDYVDGTWVARIEQSVSAGPSGTHVDWPFLEIVSPRQGIGGRLRERAYFEYPLGTALAMNVGLRSYMDTRIAIHLLRALPATERRTLGISLLTQAIQTNPFNPEPWHNLAALTKSAEEGMELVAFSQTRWGDADNDSNGEDRDVNQSLEAFIEEDRGKSVTKLKALYWQIMTEIVTRDAILRHPVPESDSKAQSVFAYLKSGIPNMTPAKLMPYYVRCEGKDWVKKSLSDLIRVHLATKKGKENKKAAPQFADALKAFLPYLATEEKSSTLASLIALFPSKTPANDVFLATLQKAATPPKKAKK
ncbi:MAG TPA: hypothetical protein VGB77_18640 [Abditibacteriaceae bacterium]|jgi:hypothetical protein